MARLINRLTRLQALKASWPRSMPGPYYRQAGADFSQSNHGVVAGNAGSCLPLSHLFEKFIMLPTNVVAKTWANARLLSIVIPCYNEEEVIGETVKRITAL